MRYAILSDVHGNLPALEAVREDSRRRQYDYAIYLGDAVGYYPNAAEVIEILREIVTPHPVSKYWYLDQSRMPGTSKTNIPLWIAGNHDRDLVAKHNATEEITEAATETISLTRKNLEEQSRESLEFLATVPDVIEVQLGKDEYMLSVTLVHISPHEPGLVGSYVNNPYSAKLAANKMNTPICLVGHTHIPQIFRMVENGFVDVQRTRIRSFHKGEGEFDDDVHPAGTPFCIGTEKIILNPGSIGQSRDGEWTASYAILDTRKRTFTVYRVSYDKKRTQDLTREWLKQSNLTEKEIELLIRRLDGAHG